MSHTEQHPRTRSQWRSAQSWYAKAGYIFLGLLVLSMVFGDKDRKPSSPTPAPVVSSGVVSTGVVEEKKNAPTISYDEFQKIKNGMTYNQVVEIIGGEGEVSSETDIGGTSMITYTRKGDAWLSSAIFVFQGGKLMSKVNMGLDK